MVFTIIYVKQTMFLEYISITAVPCLQMVLHVMLFRMLNIIQCSASNENG